MCSQDERSYYEFIALTKKTKYASENSTPKGFTWNQAADPTNEGAVWGAWFIKNTFMVLTENTH